MNLPERASEPGHAVVPIERLTANEIVARTRLVREVMEAVMKVNVHFGVIPGTRKPSLWQPGAEKLLMAFALAPDLDFRDPHVPPP